jgi:hypothetical protein
MTARARDEVSNEDGQVARSFQRRVRRAFPGVGVACVRDGEIVSGSTWRVASKIRTRHMRDRAGVVVRGNSSTFEHEESVRASV